MDEPEIISIRTKNRRTRIKESRAKRNQRRFYVQSGKKVYARGTGVSGLKMVVSFDKRRPKNTE